jgi:hypothetical protein
MLYTSTAVFLDWAQLFSIISRMFYPRVDSELVLGVLCCLDVLHDLVLLSKLHVHVDLGGGEGDGSVELLVVGGKGVSCDELLVVGAEGGSGDELLVVGGEGVGGDELLVVGGEGVGSDVLLVVGGEGGGGELLGNFVLDTSFTFFA